MKDKKVQSSTCQVPVGENSIFDAMIKRQISMFAVMVYLVLNYFSNWQTGDTHGKSYQQLAKLLHVDRSYVIQAVNELVEKGWLEKNIRGGRKANTYRVTHHNCAPEEVPIDKDGLPKKCAMPHGMDSHFEKLFQGEITWKSCLYWCVSKVVSDWTSGIFTLTTRQAKEWLRFSSKTICEIRENLSKAGLLERISQKFTAFIAQLFPKPYEKRRKRRSYNPKMLRCDGKFYYSFNEKWRLSRETADIYTQEGSGWRYASEHELEEANPKIHKDFMEYKVPILEMQRLYGSEVSA